MTALRLICLACLFGSIALVAAVVGWDCAHGLRPLAFHQRGTAIALMLVGASYALAHLLGPMAPGPRARAISLGGAFVLWGLEQFLPTGPWTTVLDCVLVTVFVADLSLAVKSRLVRGAS